MKRGSRSFQYLQRVENKGQPEDTALSASKRSERYGQVSDDALSVSTASEQGEKTHNAALSAFPVPDRRSRRAGCQCPRRLYCADRNRAVALPVPRLEWETLAKEATAVIRAMEKLPMKLGVRRVLGRETPTSRGNPLKETCEEVPHLSSPLQARPRMCA